MVTVADCIFAWRWRVELDLFASCFNQFAKLYAGWAGSFARSTANATVHMFDEIFGDLKAPLGHSLHLVNTPARRVHLDTQDGICGTGGQAETAVDTLAHEIIGMGMAL